MTPAEKVRYDRNPAIAAMGLDAVPRVTEELTERCRYVDLGNVRHPDSARLKAIQIKPFTGNPPWRKWLSRYQNISKANGYTNQQGLAVLKEALAEGPGEMALKMFEEHGDETLASLIEQATHVLVKVGEEDPKAQLAKRKQLKDENIRVYGFAIQELVSELYRGCRADTPVLIQEATTRFVNGVRDHGCQVYLQEKWEPEISMADLFNLADVYEAKRAVFPSIGGSASVEITEPQVECAAWTNQKPGGKFNGQGKPAYASNTNSDSDMRRVFGEMLEEKDEKKAVDSKGSGKPKPSNKKHKPGVCGRCQKPGHYARDCKAPAPVPRVTEAEKSPSEN